MRKPAADLRAPALLAVAVALLLVVLLVEIAPTAASTRCIFDELQHSRLGTGTSTVIEQQQGGAPLRQTAEPQSDTHSVRSWKPIRISLFTEDLDNSLKHCKAVGELRPDLMGGFCECTSDDILTDVKKQRLLDVLLPSAVGMHRDRLLVQPLRSNLIVGNFNANFCSMFTVPESHRITGVPNADFALYVAAAPISSEADAWASICQQSRDGRPLVGVVNVSPKNVNDFFVMRGIAHEILHALGFSINIFRPRGMTELVSVRGKPPSYVITSNAVLRAARDYYKCDSMEYVELEDAGGSSTAGSHWKMRSAKDELMAPIFGEGIYTAMTIAAMVDTGYYMGNYRNAESMTWGKGAGCVLFDEKCVVNGEPMLPKMFCNKRERFRNSRHCTLNRLGIGSCDLVEMSGLTPPFHYFNPPTLAGSRMLMDYCPYIKDYKNTKCMNGDQSVLPGSVFSDSARCFSAEPQGGGPMTSVAVCADVLCDEKTKSYRVRVKGASDFADCFAGRTLEAWKYSTSFPFGAIECPPYEEVCTRNPSVHRGADMSNYNYRDEKNVLKSGVTQGAYYSTIILSIVLTSIIAFISF